MDESYDFKLRMKVYEVFGRSFADTYYVFTAKVLAQVSGKRVYIRQKLHLAIWQWSLAAHWDIHELDEARPDYGPFQLTLHTPIRLREFPQPSEIALSPPDSLPISKRKHEPDPGGASFVIVEEFAGVVSAADRTALCVL
jgi:hypothetical protein